MSQVVLQSLTLLFHCDLFQSRPFISELILRALLSSDKRQEDGGMLEEWGLSLPHALAFGFLSLARCLSSYPPPLLVTLATAGILPLCIPLSIHHTIPPSMSLSQRQRCGVRARLAAPSEECNRAAFLLAQIFRLLPSQSHRHVSVCTSPRPNIKISISVFFSAVTSMPEDLTVVCLWTQH